MASSTVLLIIIIITTERNSETAKMFYALNIWFLQPKNIYKSILKNERNDLTLTPPFSRSLAYPFKMMSWFQEFIRHFKALLQSEITQKWLRKVRTLYCTQINKTCVGHFKQQQQKTNKTNVQYERVALVCYSWFFNYLTFYKELHVGVLLWNLAISLISSHSFSQWGSYSTMYVWSMKCCQVMCQTS